jgi:hypothetical protein
MTNHAVQSGSHSRADRGNDLYDTPTCATEALLRAEQLPHAIWEPAAGRGAIVKVLRDAGHAVIAGDIVDYGFPLHYVGDFLVQTKAPPGCTCILTNPPYGRHILNRFVAHALDLAPRVMMLVPYAFIGSAGRTEILERRGLARFPSIPLAPPHDAPRRLGREENQFKSDVARVAGLGAWLSRPSNHPANFPISPDDAEHGAPATEETDLMRDKPCLTSGKTFMTMTPTRN